MVNSNKMVSSWLTRAGRDLRTAKALFDLGDDFFENAAYHSQQCAEKAIKGWLASHKKAFKKSHDIKYLLDLVSQIDSGLARSLAAATDLSNYAIAARYPDAVEEIEINKAKVSESIKIAEDVYQKLSKMLSSG